MAIEIDQSKKTSNIGGQDIVTDYWQDVPSSCFP